MAARGQGGLLSLEETGSDPLEVFERWLAEARAGAGPDRADAMALATAGSDGRPAARMVMLRGFDRRGFVFYTNHQSRKGRQLEQNPRAALVFHWPELHRQVTVEGIVQRVPREESEAYFRTRPLGHRLSAWASEQDRPLPGHWGGYRLTPLAVEFWQGREDRLHDRVRCIRSSEGEPWDAARLYP